MLFNSFEYVIFLPCVFVIYWMVRSRYRNLVLLIASSIFYAFWSWKYFIIFVLEIVITFWCGLFIEKNLAIKKQRKAKGYCIGCIVLCISVLFVFKYCNFVIENINGLLKTVYLDKLIEPLNLILPVGISFYTFQSLGYIVDVYHKKATAEHNFISYASFISFFPQLVAGPIERLENLLPQIKSHHKFSYVQASYGLKLMAWGYFKKIVLADTLAIVVDKIWTTPTDYVGFELITATFGFAIQIYCDFSGYSDIARGTAKLFGIELSENFKSPYLSKSLKEFWSRWHISLSAWLRDYIYIPLGGSKKGKLKYIKNIMITFLVSGIWHGANWTFLAWGGANGALLIFQKGMETICNHVHIKKYVDYYGNDVIIKRAIVILRIFATNCIVLALWVLFRSQTITEAIYIIKASSLGISVNWTHIQEGLNIFGYRIWIDIFVLLVFDIASKKFDVIEEIGKLKYRWGIYITFILFTYYQIPQKIGSAFLYFQF